MLGKGFQSVALIMGGLRDKTRIEELAGKNLTNLTKNMSWSEAGPMWQRMSATFAKVAKGTVHVFHNAQGINLNSVWRTIEYPILNNIIYHI